MVNEELNFNLLVERFDEIINEPEIKLYLARKKYEEEDNVELKKEYWKNLFNLKKDYEVFFLSDQMLLMEDRKSFTENVGLPFLPELMKCQFLSLERFLTVTDKIFKESPFRFAINLARLRRRNLEQYNYISLMVKNGSNYGSIKREYAKVAMQLAIQEYELKDQVGFKQLVNFFNVIKINDLSALFRSSFYKNINILKKFVRFLLEEEKGLSLLSYEGLHRLIVLSYAHLSEDEYINLLENSFLLFNNNGVDEIPNTAESAVASISKNTISSLSLGVNGFNKDTPLRIAVCISGQMRAYKEAFKTWGNLDLNNHDVDYYIHTWKEVGFRLPDPISGNGANRVFGHKPFINAYMKAGALYGDQSIYDNYPSLFEKIKTGSNIVTKKDLISVYGENVKAIIEDESSLVFLKNKDNQEKMFYKIKQSNNQVIDSGKKYDLVIRIRPDKIFLESKDSIDWYSIAKISHDKNVLFSEPVSVTNFLYIDDQFAVACPKVMTAYANTDCIQEIASKENWYGFTPRLIAHRTLAYSLLYQGILVRGFNNGKIGGMASSGLLSKEEIRSLLLCDLPNGPKTNMDHLLINSLK